MDNQSKDMRDEPEVAVPFRGHLDEEFKLVRGLEIPMITRKSSYPFAELRLHDAIIFESARELKNALQAARTYRKHTPKFKVAGRKITRGQYAGKFAIIRVA